MHRCAESTVRFREQLSLQHSFADADDRMCGVANMLRNGQYELFRNGHVQNGRRC